MAGVEPQTAFEGYIKGQIESLNRDVVTMKGTLGEMRDSWIFARGKVAGLAAAWGIAGGAIVLLVKVLWKG